MTASAATVSCAAHRGDEVEENISSYRRMPASGVVNVTMALTGLGTVYFRHVRIEPLTGGNGTATVAINRIKFPLPL